MSDCAVFGEIAPGALRVEQLGSKGAWLHWLASRSAPVPPGFVLSPSDVAAVAEGGALPEPAARACAQLAMPGWTAPLAVRASPGRSLPGQLPTELGCSSLDDVVQVLGAIHRAALAEAADPCAAVVQREVRVPSHGWSAAVFTRDPTRGHSGLRGSFHPGGPAAAVMDGRHTLPDVSEGAGSLRRRFPDHFAALSALAAELEWAAGRILELEVVHDGTSLWLVQARPAPRAPLAAIRLASERAPHTGTWLDLCASDAEGQWVERVVGDRPPLAVGLAACPGVATGAPVTDPAEAQRRAAAGEAVVLVRPHALPEDVSAVAASAGVLTSTGGLTCHAAVIARGLGKPAVVSCRGLTVDAGGAKIAGTELRSDVPLTLDGHSGQVFTGPVATVRVPSGAPLMALLGHLQARRRLPLWVHELPASLWANAVRAGVDAVLVEDVGEPGAVPGGLEVWRLEPDGRHARRLDEEQSGPSRVRLIPWAEVSTAGEGVWWVRSGPRPLPPPVAAAPRALVVPAEHMLPWALTLDPVQADAHNGPFRVGSPSG